MEFFESSLSGVESAGRPSRHLRSCAKMFLQEEYLNDRFTRTGYVVWWPLTIGLIGRNLERCTFSMKSSKGEKIFSHKRSKLQRKEWDVSFASQWSHIQSLSCTSHFLCLSILIASESKLGRIRMEDYFGLWSDNRRSPKIRSINTKLQ